MRIPRLLEVLGRVGRQHGAAKAASAAPAPAGGAAPRAGQEAERPAAPPAPPPSRPAPYAPEPRTTAASPRIYVEAVEIRTGSPEALLPPEGIRVPPQPAGPPATAPAARPATRAGRQQAGRERIAITAEVAPGGQALRRPPAARTQPKR